MRVAKFSRTLLLLALPAVPAACALAQDHPNVQPSAVRDQLMKPAPGVSQPKTPAVKPASTQAPVTKNPQAKPAVKAPAKGTSQKNAKPPAEKPAEEKISTSRRDPFETLLNRAKGGSSTPENLPPGKAGLMVGTLRIDGIVNGAGGTVAIVSNPQQRVYFLRDGDKLYDGSVEKITIEGITFHEVGKDAFGKPLERQVTKRLYPSPGEQQ